MTEPVPPVILIPGYWLGGWAWSAVAGQLRSAGLTVTSLTLPGLESPETSREGVQLRRPRRRGDRRAARGGAGRAGRAQRGRCRGHGRPRSGARPGGPGDLCRERADARMDPCRARTWTRQRSTCRCRRSRSSKPRAPASKGSTNPHSSASGRAPRRIRSARSPSQIELRNPRRNDVPATVVCCSFPSAMVAQATDETMFAPLRELDRRDLCRPADRALADVVKTRGAGDPDRGGRPHPGWLIMRLHW